MIKKTLSYKYHEEEKIIQRFGVQLRLGPQLISGADANVGILVLEFDQGLPLFKPP